MESLTFEQALYLYGIGFIRTREKMDKLRLTGIDGQNPVFFVNYRDLFGAASSVPMSEFGQEALDESIKNIKWLEKKAFLHESIIEQLMQVSTLIPMRFCTIFKSSERIREVLLEHYPRFVENLKFLENKEEWSVKAYIDRDVMEKEVIRLNDRVQKLEKTIKASTSGKAFFLKKKLQSLVKDEIDEAGLAYADKCYRRLGQLAEGSCLNRLLGKDESGKDMVLNAVFLVSRDKIEEFKMMTGLLEQEYGYAGVVLAVSGSWPAYHFCLDIGNGRDADE